MHTCTHVENRYWTMHYDASPVLMKSLVDRLQGDPRVIRWTTLKLGERPDQTATAGSKTVITRDNGSDDFSLEWKDSLNAS